ncbi:Uncharacterised protein [Neisseria meningitidis]|nr:Uncharacterised protein [Neisseria meningitidis]CWO54596.1 Uncharacterised protein [Neisseria meningitidis]CWR20533.1 Uncharacterised protein [Neisseria meningitidis]
MPLILPRVRRLDTRFQITQIKFTASHDIFDLFFIQQVQFGVQIKGDGVGFVPMGLIIPITDIACRINEVFVFVLAERTIILRHLLVKRRFHFLEFL